VLLVNTLFYSIARFDLEILDDKGNVVPIEDLPEGISITSLVEVEPIITQEQLKKMCFGYMKEGQKDWTCLGDTIVEKTQRKK